MAFQKRPHFVSGARYPLPADAQRSPPVPCKLKVGDRVTYTNDYGVSFHDELVTGFSPTVESYGGFVYLDKDSWWFPVPPGALQLQRQPDVQASESVAAAQQ